MQESVSGIEMIPHGAKAPPKLQARMDWVGAQIRKFRKEAGLTQHQLSEKADLPQSHVSVLERGKHSPSHKTLSKIAEALGIELHTLDPS